MYYRAHGNVLKLINYYEYLYCNAITVYDECHTKMTSDEWHINSNTFTAQMCHLCYKVVCDTVCLSVYLYILLLSSLSLKSGVRLALILVVVFPFFITDPVSLPSHSRQIYLHTVLPSQSWSPSSPSTFHSKHIHSLR